MLRVYLSGQVALEHGGRAVDPRAFPGQQGRMLFCFLTLRRGMPVARSTLVDALWDDSPPRAWETALSALASKLRGVLSSAGLDGVEVLRAAAGCYELHLPPGTWVDQEVALDSIHTAEAALRRGDHAAAYGPSAVAQHIARRPFLPGATARWVDPRREKMQNVLVRALECRAEVYVWNREPTLAVEVSNEAIALMPFRESAYRALMVSHEAAGNRGEALRAYERCRELLRDELGVAPSDETRRVRDAILRGETPTLRTT